jgi:hypothetical protein
MRNIYVKEGQVVLQDICNRFIYEVFVFVHHKNIFSTINHKYYSSEVEIKNIIENYKVTENITVNCEMYSAPLKWLLDNEFQLYVKPEKKKRKKNEQKVITVKS